MNIAYCAGSIIPSATANGTRVICTCQTFANNGHRVVPKAPRGNAGVVDAGTGGLRGVDRVVEVVPVAATKPRGRAALLHGRPVEARVRRQLPPPDDKWMREENVYPKRRTECLRRRLA